jgi:hypothetical protein
MTNKSKYGKLNCMFLLIQQGKVLFNERFVGHEIHFKEKLAVYNSTKFNVLVYAGYS